MLCALCLIFYSLSFKFQYFQDFGDIFENALDKVKEFSFDLIILIVLHILLSYFEDLSICDSDSFSKEHEDTKALLVCINLLLHRMLVMFEFF